MHLAVLLATLLQQPAAPAAPPPFPVAKVEVTPPATEIEVGQTVRLSARALDARGEPVTDAKIEWYSGGTEGSVDSTGLVKGGYNGHVRVTAVAYIPGQKGQTFGTALIHVLPEAAARIDIVPAPSRIAAGTRLTLTGTAYSRHGDRRPDLVSFSSSNPRVASVTGDGRLHALSPGRATVTAKAGSAAAQLSLQVVPNTVARLAIEPATVSVRTGDVVRFSVSGKDAAGRAIQGVPVEWAVAAASGAGVAAIDPAGAFVAETPGVYTVTAAIGARTADAVVRVEQRRVTRGIEVVAHLPVKYRAAEVWVHPSGKCLYMSTIADRVYAVDITDPASPRVVDSMITDARIVNDVMTTEDGKYGVFSREGASNRKNGIVVFDAGDPCHPKPIAEYTETVSGGVHSSYVYQGRAYITDDATYARVEQLWGPGFVRGTHTAWRQGKYVFAGDEVYAARPYKGLSGGNGLTFGRLQVVGDTLYLGNYQGGARVLDVSGELKGDLLRQGREISWILTADSTGVQPHTPFAWGAVVRDGSIFVPDINSGLWVLRLEPRPQPVP